MATRTILIDTVRKIAAPILAEYPAAKHSDAFFSRHFANTLTRVVTLLNEGFSGTAAETIAEAHRIEKITAKQYETMAPWKRESVERVVKKLVDVTPAQAPKRRGRPPKNGVTMTNAERQDALQKRRRQATKKLASFTRTLDEIQKVVHWLDMLVTSPNEPKKKDISQL
ncbi:MAG: hypothetical protein E5Y31_25970, partial [Mesorhizobium sp.]